MQKTENGLIVIACDFTGIEWDEHIPMIEGHRGSVICLEALKMAIDGMADASEAFDCTLCLRHTETGSKAWRHPDPPATANPHAIVCEDCIRQADRAFSKDPDTDYVRRIPPTDRWR